MRHGASRALSLLAIACAASGCSSSLKQYNPKMGLLDVLAGMEPANPSNDRQEYAAIDGDRARGGAANAHAGSDVFPIPPRGQARASRALAAVAIPESQRSNVALEWPLRHVEITSPFGRRGREFHEGVDLRARSGTPVYASHSGQVLYSGSRIRGYGEMIVLRHSSGLATIYAHNSRLVVRKGAWVRKGELIAYTGQTGDARGPHLHFEIREGVNAVDPLHLLPKPASRAVALR